MEGDRGGGGSPGEKGRGAGGERAGSGILKMAGTGRKRVKFRNVSLYFGKDIRQEERTSTESVGGGGEKKVREAGVQGTGGGRFRPPCPPALIWRAFMACNADVTGGY